MNSTCVLIALAVLGVAGCSPKSIGGAAATLNSDQRILAGGAAPPAVRIDTVNPYADDAASAAEGKRLFASMNCEGCHSQGGEGAWAPSIITGRWRYGGTDAAVFETIFYGRPRGMPAFGGILSPPLTWKLVTFIRSVPPPKAVPTQSWQ